MNKNNAITGRSIYLRNSITGKYRDGLWVKLSSPYYRKLPGKWEILHAERYPEMGYHLAYIMPRSR